MDSIEILLGLIIGIAGSIIANLIWAKASKRREKNIARKIQELEYEEKFLERISKGNVELIRSGFRVFSLTLSLAFASGALVLITYGIPLLAPLRSLACFIAFGMWIGGAAGCYSYFQSLSNLRDLKAAKAKLTAKREKLEEKLY